MYDAVNEKVTRGDREKVYFLKLLTSAIVHYEVTEFITGLSHGSRNGKYYTVMIIY